ncbi:hypothetical protein HMPREF0501_00957 [Limosilactobacillus coleohominis 101-4-CHN]|uniref:Uncharacterized protein n=1 Tax=Limosilactobacillus coleohominis 101-4-CHN TaxID=575594 RepID=C7XV48_9LACO|nr:hypothetical protein [Limosilactobacillus coleohominis]EEU30579.1 hypothetical protein HMPREF0501_00957 [Limosilactobacillus coleohominis 101-4-CHN]
MDLQRIFQLSGVIAVVLLVLQYLVQVLRMKRGHSTVRRWRVFINWLLIVIFFVGFGGGGYLSYKSGQAASHESSKKSTKVKEGSNDQISLTFNKKVHLDENGERRVSFKVSPNTHLKIVGHYSKKVYKEFNVRSGKNKGTFHYTFRDSGTYDIVAENGKRKITKKLVVEDNPASSHESSIQSSSVSSSSTSSSSSSSNRVANNTGNGRNGTTGGSPQSGLRSYANSYTTNRPASSNTQTTPSEQTSHEGTHNGGGE